MLLSEGLDLDFCGASIGVGTVTMYTFADLKPSSSEQKERFFDATISALVHSPVTSIPASRSLTLDLIYIETNGCVLFPKFHSKWQSNITQTNNSNFTFLQFHTLLLNKYFLILRDIFLFFSQHQINHE